MDANCHVQQDGFELKDRDRDLVSESSATRIGDCEERNMSVNELKILQWLVLA